MPNATSETHRKWCFWLLFPLAAAMNFSYLYIRSPNRKTPWKKAAPGSKTPWLWRTEKPQNCTPKMPNATSETHRKWCFWLLFPLAAAMNFNYLYIRSPNRKTPWKKAAPGSKTPWLWRTEKPQNCTPKMPNATSETHRKWCFWLLFPLAAAMNFSYLYIRSPNRKTPWKKAAPGSKTPWLWRTEKPQNCTPKMPNVTSETHRKWCFWLLFPLAAAMNFSYLYIRSPNRKTPWKKAAPGSKTPWLWRTEKPQNCTPKMPNATSETHRKWCFWLLFPLAAAMNFSYLYIRSPNRKTPWKKAAPGSKTPWLWRTEKPQNCTPKMPNATSETHRKWCFWLLFPLAAAMNFSYLYIRSPNRKTPWKKAAPGSKTPWLWRTEKPQNCTPKMPNATSETHRKWCFWLLFPLAAAMNFSYLYIRSPNRKTPWKKAAPGSKTPWHGKKQLPAAKHHGSEGRRSPKIVPRKCLTRFLKPIENDAFGSFFLLLLPWILATFTSGPQIGKHHGKKQLPAAKHHGSEGRRSPKIVPRKCLTRLLNDAFGSFFLLLLPWILATFTSGPQIGKHHGKKQLPAAKHHGSEGRRSPKIVPRKCLTRLLKPIENDAFGSFFLLLLPWILATFTSGPQIGKHHGKKQLPAAKHHGSEGRRSPKIVPRKCLTRLLKPIENDAFGSFFLLLLPWILATFTSGPQIGKHHGKKQLPAAKHHGSEGRRSPKIVPRKCLTRLLKPIENDAFGSFFLLLLPWILATFTSGPQIGKHHGKKQLPAAKHHGSEGRRSPKIVPRKCLTRLLKPIENDAFGSFFLLLLPWILATFTSGPQIAKHHGKKQLPAAKHHGSEGRRSPKIVPRKCLTWLLKPIENDAFGSFFLLLLPWILATFTSGPQIGKHHGKKQLPAAKHHGSEGRRSPKIVPRKCLTWLLKPIENDAFGSFFLLLLPWILATFTSGPQIGKHHGKKQLPAAKHHGSEGRRSLKIIPRKCLTRLLKPIENDAFGSFFLLLLPWILATFTSGPQIGKHHGKKQLPAAKHHGSEGRRSPKIVPRKCLTRLLKPIENDAFGSFFLLLLPWILATFTSGPQIGKHHGKKQLPAAKHHGSEGRRSPKIVPRKCLTWLLKPIENDAFGSFFLLLLPWILATFTSGPQIGKHHGKKQLPAAKHHGSEGWLMARQELPAAASAGVCCCLLLPAAACLLLPAAASAGVCWCLLLPAAACCCLPLPAAACGSLLLPAAPCCSLLLPAAGAAASCCCCCGAAVLLLQSNSLQSKKQTARHPFRNTSETAKHHLFAGCLPLPAAACCCPEGSHNLQPKKSTAAAAVAVAVCWVLAADNWLPATCFLTAGCSAAACQLLLPLAAAKT